MLLRRSRMPSLTHRTMLLPLAVALLMAVGCTDERADELPADRKPELPAASDSATTTTTDQPAGQSSSATTIAQPDREPDMTGIVRLRPGRDPALISASDRMYEGISLFVGSPEVLAKGRPDASSALREGDEVAVWLRYRLCGESKPLSCNIAFIRVTRPAP